MIDFKSLELSQMPQYNALLQSANHRGCEYSFVNLYLWGRQKAAFLDGHLVLFSQFQQKSVYPFPVGQGAFQPVLDTIIQDAHDRGISCRFVALTGDDCARLEQAMPGRFRFHFDRDSFDYVYAVDDLADLKGRKYQKKRNHLNRFRADHPNSRLVPITAENTAAVSDFVAQWYHQRQQENPHADYHMEQVALKKALAQREALGMEGLVLEENGKLLAMTMGSRLNADTFDIHFEKALDIYDGTYAAINQGFASYLREKHPTLRWLNREDDMGLEGLRKAKLSYCPDHMVEKSWACLLEDDDEN